MSAAPKLRQSPSYPIAEACERIGVRREFLVRCISARWIRPVAPDQAFLDDEDLARARLIHELMEDFGANAESIPIILHLLDQLYYLKAQARFTSGP
jgi:chaperone modulatory protein CbpM